MKRLVILPAILLLAACGSIESGTVVDKDHHDAWSQLTLIGKAQHWIHHPECWELTLDDGNDTGEVCVDRQVWESISVGERFEGEG